MAIPDHPSTSAHHSAKKADEGEIKKTTQKNWTKSVAVSSRIRQTEKDEAKAETHRIDQENRQALQQQRTEERRTGPATGNKADQILTLTQSMATAQGMTAIAPDPQARNFTDTMMEGWNTVTAFTKGAWDTARLDVLPVAVNTVNEVELSCANVTAGVGGWIKQGTGFDGIEYIGKGWQNRTQDIIARNEVDHVIARYNNGDRAVAAALSEMYAPDNIGFFENLAVTFDHLGKNVDLQRPETYGNLGNNIFEFTAGMLGPSSLTLNAEGKRAEAAGSGTLMMALNILAAKGAGKFIPPLDIPLPSPALATAEGIMVQAATGTTTRFGSALASGTVLMATQDADDKWSINDLWKDHTTAESLGYRGPEAAEAALRDLDILPEEPTHTQFDALYLLAEMQTKGLKKITKDGEIITAEQLQADIQLANYQKHRPDGRYEIALTSKTDGLGEHLRPDGSHSITNIHMPEFPPDIRLKIIKLGPHEYGVTNQSVISHSGIGPDDQWTIPLEVRRPSWAGEELGVLPYEGHMVLRSGDEIFDQNLSWQVIFTVP